MSAPFINIDSFVRHDYARVNGINLHYAESLEELRSDQSTQLVILLHGFPECWYSWRHQLKALGRDFRAVAVDMRGYNLSDKPARVEGYRIEMLASDVVGLMDHFGARKAAVVGHDWGAAVAWNVAQLYPDRVSKVAALQVPPIAAWLANMTLKQALSSWYMLFFQLPYVPEWMIGANDFASLDRTFKRTAVRPQAFSGTDIAIYKAAMRERGALTSAINYYRANFAPLFLSGKRGQGSKAAGDGRVRAPSLFIYGEKDFAILPETVRGVDRYVDAPYREVRIATSGHWVQQEAAAEVTAALMDFLKAA
ncbi:MAG: alpha/beta fold hydrolase [Pyrinomonadaceae bacterium]